MCTTTVTTGHTLHHSINQFFSNHFQLPSAYDIIIVIITTVIITCHHCSTEICCYGYLYLR